MLDLLSKVAGADLGIGVISYSGSASDLFLQLHFCSTFLARKKHVLIISSHQTESNYRLIFGKLALRWEPSLINIVELDALLGAEFRIGKEKVVETLEKLSFGESLISLLIFDDVCILERLGVKPSSVVRLLYAFYNRLEQHGLLLASFSIKTRTHAMMTAKADFTIDVNPVGLGYGKDVSGKMDINVRKASPLPTSYQLLFLTGDRSIKCFYPGGNSFLSI